MPTNGFLYLAVLIAGGVAATTFFLFLFKLLFENRMNIKDRISTQLADEKPMTFDDLEIEKAIQKSREGKGLKGKFLTSLGKPFQRLPMKDQNRQKRKNQLIRAGLLFRPEEVAGMEVLSSLITGMLLYIFTRSVWLMLAGLIIGFLLPGNWIKGRIKKRAKQLSSQLPDALGIIANGIRAGLSLTQAMALVTQELEAPIGEEFAKLLHENSMGKTMEEALVNLSDRTQDEDLEIFITSLLIQRQVGGNLAEILDTISDTIRDRVRLKGEIKSLTAQGKISAVVVTLLPFAMGFMVNLINPGYLDPLFHTAIGQVALVGGLVLIFIGIQVIRKIIDIKV